jgi:Zn finger protein HypA/HybF involved in hydrogenase expression
MLNDEKRGIEEMYTSAMTSSNLRVEADRPGDADVIIASGWNQSRIGGALLRLHTEWDSSEKPRMAAPEQFLSVGKTTKEQRAHAARQAHALNLHEMGLLLGKLKALPDVRLQMTLQLLKWGSQDAEQKSAEIIRWWLSQACPACGGTKFQVVEGTNRHGSKACKVCAGTGKRAIPHGQEGRRAANWMDQCVERARASIQRRLRPDRISA